MSEKQERLADELAEMRKMPQDIIVDAKANFVFQRYADRIEAAWKREREELEGYAKSKMLDGATIIDNRTVGNAAAMREALEMMSALFANGVICTSYANTPEEMEQIEELCRKAKAALSAPPRNCDVYQSDEEAFNAWKAERGFRNVGLGQGGYGMAWAFVRWLFFTIKKEGGAK